MHFCDFSVWCTRCSRRKKMYNLCLYMYQIYIIYHYQKIEIYVYSWSKNTAVSLNELFERIFVHKMDTAILILLTKVKVDLLWTGEQCETLIYVLIVAAKMISWNYSGYNEKKRRERRKNKERRTQKEKRANILCAEKKKTYNENDKISGETKYLIYRGDEELREKRGNIWRSCVA